jgi:enamine deaminase RidA (YjgF/YER057c/UK114 family)
VAASFRLRERHFRQRPPDFVAGVVGRAAQGAFATGFVARFRQSLHNTLAILDSDAATAKIIVRMTWFVRDIDD